MQAQVQEANRMLKEFEQMQDMMKKMKGGGMMKMMKRIGGMGGMGGMKGMPKFWAYHHGLWQATRLNQRSDRGNTSRSP